MGMGKIPYSSFNVQLYFPILGLAVILKKRFPHERQSRSWGNFSSVFLLSLSWGNIIVPFMTHREFLFPSLAAARLVKEISRPHFLKWQDWANVLMKFFWIFSIKMMRRLGELTKVVNFSNFEKKNMSRKCRAFCFNYLNVSQM